MTKTAVPMAVALLWIFAWQAHAGPHGAPQPDGERYPLSAGIGAFRNATKWKPDGGNFSAVEIRQNQVYLEAAHAGYCFTEEGEGFLRIGAADFDDGERFKDGFKPFGAAGIRDIWYGEGRSPFKVGTVVQGSYFPGFDAETTFVPGSPAKAKVKGMWEVSLGIAAQFRAGEKTLFYAGPQVTYSRAKVTREAAGSSDSATFTEKRLAGAFGGVKFPILERLTFEVEGQYRSGFSGGAFLAYLFR